MTTGREPDHVVIRPAADLPAGFLPSRLDGLWLDRAGLSQVGAGQTATQGGAVAVPSGRFESRDDGAVAEVYEVRP